jgi:ABC-type transport system substrate-binding protein
VTAGRRAFAALVAAALVAGGCGDTVAPTPTPLASLDTGDPTPPPLANEPPFVPTAWPATGSACALDGYTGRLGRIEALNARTVRITLCAPDGALPARLAHPALGVVDAAWVDRIAADPAVARLVPGAGTFRVDAWSDDNVRLARLGDESGSSPAPSAGASAGASPGPAGPPPMIVLRWAASSTTRSAALRDAEVDGIDAPTPADSAELETLPELQVLPRPGMATAYLGFGAGRPFAPVAVRRAFAQGLDHEALARDAFPPGSAAATHAAPCAVAGGCAGLDWYEFNGPAGAAALDLAEFDPEARIVLHVPDAPVPGLPDPAGVGAAVRDQLAESLGVTVGVDVQPVADLAAAITGGEVSGLYLWGVASSLADASGFLEPVAGRGVAGTAANRAKGARGPLGDAAAATDPIARLEALAAASDALRASAAIVPLVHPGATVAYRADVSGIAVSPLGVDPLGDIVPGDRAQVVVMEPDAPAAAWCAAAPDPGSLRLCALVSPGLYAFTDGSLVPRPALAVRCTPAEGAVVWTCRLRERLRFGDGRRVDAGDVLASIRAQADAAGPLRAALPTERFAAWDELFDGPVATGP